MSRVLLGYTFEHICDCIFWEDEYIRKIHPGGILWAEIEMWIEREMEKDSCAYVKLRSEES